MNINHLSFAEYDTLPDGGVRTISRNFLRISNPLVSTQLSLAPLQPCLTISGAAEAALGKARAMVTAAEAEKAKGNGPRIPLNHLGS